MLKNATHIGTIETRSGSKEVWLRETKKTWTDGVHRWKKLDLYGNEEINPIWYRGGVWPGGGVKLITSSIRQLTTDDRRQLLLEAVGAAESLVERRHSELDAAKEALNEAVRQQVKAFKALRDFDRTHGSRAYLEELK